MSEDKQTEEKCIVCDSVRLVRDYQTVSNYDLYDFVNRHTLEELETCLKLESSKAKKAYMLQAVAVLRKGKDNPTSVDRHRMCIEINYITEAKRRAEIISVVKCNQMLISFVRVGKEGAFTVLWYNPATPALVGPDMQRIYETEEELDAHKEWFMQVHSKICSPYTLYCNWGEVKDIVETLVGESVGAAPGIDQGITMAELRIMKEMRRDIEWLKEPDDAVTESCHTDVCYTDNSANV